MIKACRLKAKNPTVLFRIVVSAAVILFGLVIMMVFASLKKPPKQKEIRERALSVATAIVQAGEYPVMIAGFGEVRSLNVVSISPEVTGRVIEVHPRLEQGEVIQADAVLFRIDSTKHEAARDEARAQVLTQETGIHRWEEQLRIDRNRLAALDRNETLAKEEFERVKRLFENDQVGTRSGVEATERAYNNARDQAALLRRAVDLYPVEIQEAKSVLVASRARLSRATYDLERCTVSVPFSARVKQVNLEAGQLVSVGSPVLTLADDSILELHVPLDSRDARSLLTFDAHASDTGTAWFQQLAQQPCTVRWTEARETHTWPAQLHRVVRFEAETRTLTVAVRVSAEQARAGDAGLPLTEGMFCSVSIPGRPLENVIQVPRSAVSFDNHVFVAISNRLYTVPVEVAYADAEHAYLSAGLAAGDELIVTRLTHPLENALLSITAADSEE